MTTSARSAMRSVTFPLPSSPHWAPTTTSPGIPVLLRFDAVRHRRRFTEVPFLVHVGELRVTGQEGKHDVPDRAVPVLGDDDVGFARTLGVAVVVLVAVDEHDDVRVLLDLARLAQ